MLSRLIISPILGKYLDYSSAWSKKANLFGQLVLVALFTCGRMAKCRMTGMDDDRACVEGPMTTVWGTVTSLVVLVITGNSTVLLKMEM